MTQLTTAAPASTTLDPITTEVLWTRLISVVDEAALTLHRVSFSTVVRESHDYSCMLLDPKGQAVAQATRSIPSFIGTLPMSVRAFLKRYPGGTLKPGDVLISNDPWIGTGHLPDLTVAAPVFHNGVLVGMAGVVAHMADIGGRRRAPDNRDIYEEGLQIPILKLYEASQPNETLFSIIRQNVRVADEVTGDIHAMVGACERIQTGVDRLLNEYGMSDISDITTAIVSLTEQGMRRAITAIPDGVYKSVTHIDTFDTNRPLTIVCEITIDGDQIFVDFDGSSPQNDFPLNSVLGYTQAYSIYAIKCLLQPDIANNEGGSIPITITAPDGSFLNPRYPAAVEARASVGHYCTSAIFNTLAKAIPDRVPAESGIPLHGFALSGHQDGRPFSTIFFFNGGQGARPTSDGLSTLSFPTNVSTTPIELLERTLPIRITEKSYLPESSGAGQFKGGMGQRVALEVTGDDPVYAVLLSQRLKYPPLGRQGGENGSLEQIILNGENVEANKPFRLTPGDVLILDLPGGGGYGSPATS